MDIKKFESKIKKLTKDIKLLEEENSRRKNQYVTIFREFKKMKGRIGYLESQSYTQKQDNEKHFTHFEDELMAIQSTLDFFTGEGSGEIITGKEEIEEEKEETKEEKKKMIMGVNFSDAVLIPEKTKTK